ncbi:centromere protein C isoform X2 [Rhinoderma darwinii]|uniref:centromere protein C isoform X2 n=1 Tax=Rhinoderma darwinii TaxID=43563 RepID=UPI003F671DBF
MSYFLAESASNGPENEFVIEDESSCNLKSWISPVKKKKASPLSTRAKKDTPTPTPKKTNPIEASSGWQKKSENVTPLLASSTRDERPENEFVIEDESSCNLKSWISPVKKKKASPLSTRAKKDTPTPTPKKTNPIEASSGWQKKSENVTASLAKSAADERPENEFVIEDESSCNLESWISPVKKKTVSPLSTRAKKDTPTPTPKKTNPIETSSSWQKKSETLTTSLVSRAKDERMVNTEKKTNDPNARKKSFSNLFFKTATAGQIGNRLSSVVSEAPATSTTVCTNVEEFEIEDLSDINESNLLTIPVKGKSTKTGFGSKREKSMPRLPKSAKDYVDSESEEFVKYVYKKQDHPPLIKNIKELVQIPPIKTVNAELSNVSTLNHKKGAAGRNKYLPPDAALLQVVEGIEKQGPLSQDTDLPRVVEGIERKESIYGDDLPGEKQDAHHTENNGLNNMKPLQPVPHVRRSQRVRDNWSAAKLYGDLEATYSIRNRAGKGNAKSRVAVEKENISKQPDKKQEEQFSKESPEIDHGNGRQTVTGVGLQSKKRANMKDVRTPCPVDGNKVFQSGPVKRQRAVQFPRRVKSLACDLDFPAKDEHVTTEDEEDESIVSSNVEFGGEVQDLTPEDKEGEIHVSSAEKEELLKRHTIVFDPDSQSNVLVECVAQSENSKFIGSDYCTTWNSFSNNIFTTGKLIIAPQKKTKRSIVVSEIVIYYVEQGRVKLSLHESERILKDGDFFFVPPGNSWTIDNLQDKEAVLVFNFLKIHKHLA